MKGNFYYYLLSFCSFMLRPLWVSTYYYSNSKAQDFLASLSVNRNEASIYGVFLLQNYANKEK